MCTICQLIKGFKMSVMVKNVQSLFERFENKIEDLADRFF